MRNPQCPTKLSPTQTSVFCALSRILTEMVDSKYKAAKKRVEHDAMATMDDQFKEWEKLNNRVQRDSARMFEIQREFVGPDAYIRSELQNTAKRGHILSFKINDLLNDLLDSGLYTPPTKTAKEYLKIYAVQRKLAEFIREARTKAQFRVVFDQIYQMFGYEPAELATADQMYCTKKR